MRLVRTKPFYLFQSEDREMAQHWHVPRGNCVFYRALVGQDYEHTLFPTIAENKMTLWKCCNDWEEHEKSLCAISFSLQHPRVSLVAQDYQEVWAGQFRAGAPCCTVSSNLPTKQTANSRAAPAMNWIHISLCLRPCLIYSVTWPCVPNAEGSCGRWVKFIKELQPRYQGSFPSLGPSSEEREPWERGCVSLELKKISWRQGAHTLTPAPLFAHHRAYVSP